MESKGKIQSIKEVTLEIKDSFTLRQFTMILIVVCGIAANILSDYLIFGFDASIFASPAYWINLAISQGAVVMFMLCFFNITSEREEAANEEVRQLRKTIYRAHCDLSKYGMSDAFDDYVYVQNMIRKKRAYTAKMQRKIFRTKSDERKRRLEDELKRGLSIIESLHIRYNKIHVATIFSRSSLPLADDESLDDGKGRVTRRLLLNKVIWIISFGVLLSMIGYDMRAVTFGVIVKSCIKLFQAACAMYTGGSEGVNYVRGSLLTALDNRAQFIQKFIEKNMPGEKEQRLMDETRATAEQEESAEILQRREKLDNGEIGEVTAEKFAEKE